MNRYLSGKGIVGGKGDRDQIRVIAIDCFFFPFFFRMCLEVLQNFKYVWRVCETILNIVVVYQKG